MPSVFGHIEGNPAGTTFENRFAVYYAGLHRYRMGGISGAESEAADAVIVSGGYEDDDDQGDTIIYTGEGGNDSKTHIQVADQVLRRGNMSLQRSIIEGLPVRVIRGPSKHSSYAPKTGYRYDGLYKVVESWTETGKSGFLVYRFKLVKESTQR